MFPRTASTTPRATASGRQTAATSSSRRPNRRRRGSHRRGESASTTSMWVTALRDQERDPTNRDVDNEAQGLAAEAAARQGGGRGGAAPAQPVEVRIDWTGMARRARQLSVPGNNVGGLTPSPDGHSVAFTASTATAGGGRGGGGADPASGMYIMNVESMQLTRVPSAPPATAGAGGGRGRGRGAAGGGFGGGGMVFARDGRTLYFRSGSEPLCGAAWQSAVRDRSWWRGRTRRTRRCGWRWSDCRDNRGADVQPDFPAGHLHGESRDEPQSAARAGLQRRLADHEEPLLRRENAWRRLGCRQEDLRAAAAVPDGHRGTAERHDDDDR